MARTVRHEIEHVPAVDRPVEKEQRTCDCCGRAISVDADAGYANELQIWLNPDECVNTAFRRDYCTPCVEPVWEALCKLINADPQADGRDWED